MRSRGSWRKGGEEEGKEKHSLPVLVASWSDILVLFVHLIMLLTLRKKEKKEQRIRLSVYTSIFFFLVFCSSLSGLEEVSLMSP
ncbi:MAG: hypothetical protein JOS17DRAFT_766131 [Linnemannia elongata]|nr:MAG: hypothetical protein JOS17DRAFT_766131 [Linnemannia elongata]